MSLSLPPLNSLRAYECAARHMSFSLASAELNVTPAAVSHQVKLLENYLGVPLFIRLTRKLRLTTAGERLLPGVSEAFLKLREAVNTVDPNSANDVLTLRLGPSLAARWLSPRLHLFWQQFPTIDLRLYHSNSPVNFDREDIDPDVRHFERLGAQLDLYAGRLSRALILTGTLVPYCKPRVTFVMYAL